MQDDQPAPSHRTRAPAHISEISPTIRRRRVKKVRRHQQNGSPENESKRVYALLTVILTVFLMTTGIFVWAAGSWGTDNHMHNPEMKRTGWILILASGSVLGFFLLRQWTFAAIENARHRRIDRNSSAQPTDGHRSGKRRRRSSRPSAFRVE